MQTLVLGHIRCGEVFLLLAFALRYLEHFLRQGFGRIGGVLFSKAGVFVQNLAEEGDIGHHGWDVEINDHF